METLFGFPPGKNRQIVRRVRRDPQFAPQLYFVTLEEDTGQLEVSFEQAIWDATSKQIISHVFLDHVVVIQAASDIVYFAIDELDKLIYIVYDCAKELTMERMQFDYKTPDKFGYRRVCLPDWVTCASNEMFFEEREPKRFSLTAINVCPSGPGLILHSMTDYHNQHTQTGFWPQVMNFGEGGLVDVNIGMLSPVQSEEMEARSHVFSRTKDLLVLVSYHSRNPPVDAADQALRNMTRMNFLDGFMILLSHDPKLRPINTLQIDPVQLVRSFVSKSLLDRLKAKAPDRMPDFMFFGSHLQLLGHVHKNVLFFFHHNYVLAAKWPKDWYKRKQVPEMRQKRAICVDKHKKHGEIRDVWLGSTDLYFKVELHGFEAIRRMTLGHKFKDYRTCAFCGKEEKRKRKDKHGKHMSSFKVCRSCKELKLHKKCYTNGSVGCHYCSLECMRKHWKQHKIVHSSEKVVG